MFLLVCPRGCKTWVLLYTLNRRHRQMGLGYVDLLTLEDARDQAIELRRTIKRGINLYAKKGEGEGETKSASNNLQGYCRGLHCRAPARLVEP
ncbi:Arm DNA-binding domain-containing protein [Sphingobium sp. SCG-1]|uniref:Arm DNA-binding domain-containing protein n=1 Tax=Sphingobium sp. SCG-1 TaxID=2072936 RepID=UPI00166FA175